MTFCLERAHVARATAWGLFVQARRHSRVTEVLAGVCARFVRTLMHCER